MTLFSIVLAYYVCTEPLDSRVRQGFGVQEGGGGSQLSDVLLKHPAKDEVSIWFHRKWMEKRKIRKDYSRNPCDASRNFVDETDSK
jgi:hypothetical protein